MTRREIRSGGRTLRYLEAGRGDALVLIHAFPLSADMWRPQMEQPPSGWRLVAPDLREFRGPGDAAPAGNPPGESRRLTMDDLAGDVADLLDGLRIEHAVIGGLSLGGYVAFALLRRDPSRFRALILADTRAEADSEEGREARRAMQERALVQGVGAIADDMVPKLLADSSATDCPGLVREVRSLIEANSPEAIVGALAAMMTRPDSTPLLDGIRFPTLVVVGEHDRLTPVPVGEAMHRRIRGSRFTVVPGAGHLPNMERPDPFGHALETFLTRDV